MNARPLVTLMVALVTVHSVAGAQVPNPPYLSEMPSVERVMHEVTGTDAKKTALLQIEALNELQEIVKALSGPREYAGLTPDDYKWIQTYKLAASHASQEADNAFPGPYGQWKRFSLNVPIYPRDYPAFGVETQVFRRFFSAGFRAQFEKAIGADQARHEAFVRAQEQAYEQARAGANAGGGDAIANANAVALGSIFSGNTRDAVALRRCLELGHNQLECTGKGLASSLGDLIGIKSPLDGPHIKAGLRMTGIYGNASGFSLTFGEESVAVNGCGKLVQASHPYAIGMMGGRLLVQVASEPQSFVVALGPDGKFAGPGAAAIAGQVITGYYTAYVPFSADPQPYGIAAHYAQVPQYASKTERCEVGVLAPTGSTTTFASATAQAVGVFSGQSSGEANRAAQKIALPPGPRMAGQYAGTGGLKVDFQVDAAILDYGEAHASVPYTVHDTSGQVMVAVENGGTPLSLTLRPDGSISGIGNIDIAGRVMTGMTSNGPAFAPRTARCTVGNLVAQ